MLMLHFRPCVLLFVSMFCLHCTTELEKKPAKDLPVQKEEANNDKEKKNPDTENAKQDTAALATEKGFNATEEDLKKVLPIEVKKVEKTEPKEEKKVVTTPIVTNPNVAEVVKEAKSKYAFVGNFYAGMAIVQSHEGKYGYIDQYGKEVSALKYDFAEDLAGEPAMARVRIKDKVGYINHTAQEIIALKYRYIDKFYRGLAQARMIDGETYYIDRQGNHVCDALSEYHEDIARIKKGDKVGYVNSYGKIIIEPRYSYGTHFVNGQAEVKIKEKYMIINTKGECVKDCQ